MTTQERNNAITAFLGGPQYIKDTFFSHMMNVEKELIDVDDLQFHKDWNWIIQAWSKVRLEMNMTQIVAAVSCIDIADIDALYELISNVCINWCKQKEIEL